MIDIPQFKREIEVEFWRIIHWWAQNMIDPNGGFIGRIDGNDQPHPKADKSIILNTRLLWTFSKVYLKAKDLRYRNLAERAYQYIVQYFWDENYDGVYWMVDHRGNVIDEQKQIYAQAFAIYAFSAYYELTGSVDASNKIERVFNRMENHSLDKEKLGYLNVFNRDWSLASNQQLSEEDDDQVKIMNTHLHILEAYTALYQVHPTERCRQALYNILWLYLEKFCTREPCHVYLYFDEDWNPTSREKSFGHDIESSWLITEASYALKDSELTEKSAAVSIALAGATLCFGSDVQGGIFEKTDHEGEEIEKGKHWWPQAEGVVGFLNAWQLSGEEKYLTQSIKTWHFLKTHFVDLENGEWHWLIDEQGHPVRTQDKAGPWKAPYHNVRMCLEVMQRL